MHLAGKLERLGTWHADRVALIDAGGRWTFSALRARFAKVGNALIGLGLARGDRVALLMPDIREYLEADYGIMSAGLVRVPLDPRTPRDDLVSLLSHAGVGAIVTHASFYDRVADLGRDFEGLSHVVVVGGAEAPAHDYETLLAPASDHLATPGDPNDLASLNFSGGTTGAPKAIMLRHRNLMAVAQNTIAGFAIEETSVFLNVRPLWPVSQVILMSYLLAGATVVLGGQFDAPSFANLVAATGATRTSLVPTHLVRILDHIDPQDARLGRLEAVHVGGSAIPPAVYERALALLGPKIGVLYGLTEAPISAYLPPRRMIAEPDRRDALMRAVGRELFGCEIRIDDADTASDGRGEVLVRGPHVMAGYWHNEAATQAALRDGWLHTGDIGRIDAHGDLGIVGRIKEVIRSGARSVDPGEVEEIICQHPAVAEAAVVGVPDQEWGEAVTAFVVFKASCMVGEAEIIEHCRTRLAGYKKPRAVHVVASLPRSHYGKILRPDLVAIAVRARANAS